jgi:hypothetical protein
MTPRTIFLNVFPVDGYNVENKTLNGQPVIEDSSLSYILDNKTLLTTFLGLPNRKLSSGPDLSFKNLLKNFIGWRDSSYLFVNLLILPFMTAWNIILTPCKFLLNITKFVTEFIPLMLCHSLIASVAAAAVGYIDAVAPSMSRLYMAKLIGSYAGLALAGMYYFFGASITSPATNLRNTYNISKRTGTNLMGPSLGRFYGLLAGLGALISTVTMYSIFFPLAINFFATTVMPVLPGALAAVIGKVAMGLNVVFEPLAFLSAFNIVTPIAGAAPAVLGFSGLVGLTATIAGKKLGEWSERFKNLWHKGNSSQVANVDVLPPDGPQDQPQPANQPLSAYTGTSYKLNLALVAGSSPAASAARISLVDDNNLGGVSNGQPSSQQSAPQQSSPHANSFFHAASVSVIPDYASLAPSETVAPASTVVPDFANLGVRR